MGAQHDFHGFHRRRFGIDQLLHHAGDRVEHAVAEEDTDEGTDHRGADVFRDLGRVGALADGVHRDHDAQHGGQDAEARHRLGHLVQRLGRLGQFFVDGFEFLLQHAFQLVGVDLAHRHQAEVVDDERQQLRLFQDQRIALEHRAVLRRLDVGVERLQAAGRRLQQFVHQQQELALELGVVLVLARDLLHLADQFDQHVFRIGEHERAEGGAADDDQLVGLPDGAGAAAHHHVAAEYRAEHDEDAKDLHDCYYLSCLVVQAWASAAFILASALLLSWQTRASDRSSTAAISL